MSWHQLTIDVPDDLIDAVVGEVSTNDVAGVWESHAPGAGLTRLVLYFHPRSDLQQVEDVVRSVFQRAQQQSPAISRAVVEDCDWTEEWKKSYTSFPISDDFFVIPSWENTECPEERLPIRIDPGQAFGTGTHETTQMTMEALSRWLEPSHLVLDLGTGSGILAIAARLLAARAVIACDNDPVAAQVARANIERNASDHVFTFCGSLDAVQSSVVGLVLGNLTTDVISNLLPDFSRVLIPHGRAIVSGILIEQAETLRSQLARLGFRIHEEMTRGEWLAMVIEKHGR
ncbi:MAG TPA: 50S ribosomal protein L11 methyltransferase [Terriglobia bacterium]|nr:50S ribosomal protein L11 methyltransferase [Terriglobia bacterium]